MHGSRSIAQPMQTLEPVQAGRVRQSCCGGHTPLPSCRAALCPEAASGLPDFLALCGTARPMRPKGDAAVVPSDAPAMLLFSLAPHTF